MVSKIVSGKSIRGILNYNENKVGQMEAILLMAAGFPRDPDALTFKDKLQRFEMLTRQNEMSKTNAMHISLNFSTRDDVDDDLMQKIAFEYMEGIGFGNQPFLLYRHYDAAHPHCHIATVNIASGGRRLETHNIGRNQSERTRKELEIRYGLTKAEDQTKEMAYRLKPAKLEKAVYGKRETKATISAIVRDVASSYKFTSLPELNAILRQFNVVADPGEEGTKMRENKGLLYCMLGEQGEKVGVPIKASSIYSSPTLRNLEQKYKPNETTRKPYGQRLKHLLDKALKGARSLDDIKGKLHEQGIRIVLRENAQGMVYGVTFIDNATRCVFNGSDLGKAYSAKAFMERLPAEQERQDNQEQPIAANDNIETGYTHQETTTTNALQKENKPDYPANDRPVIEMLLDIALSDTYEENLPNPFRKKRKKLQAE